MAAIGPLHASTFQVATPATLELVPLALFGLAAGVWIDRLPHRPVLVIADVGRAPLLASVPGAYWPGVLTLAQIFVVAFSAGAFAGSSRWATTWPAPRELGDLSATPGTELGQPGD